MKKLIIGLLIVAAGAGTYIYFQNKKTSEKPGADHALIIGYWKADTLQSAKDNAFRAHSFLFADSSTLILTGNDSLVKKDTLQYSWDKNDQLSWKHKGDSLSVTFHVTALGKDSLKLQATDSSNILLLKAR